MAYLTNLGWIRHGLCNCQTNFNRVAVGGAGRTSFGTSAVLFGIQTTGTGILIDHCQANHNTMGDAEPHTVVLGIISDFATNTTISNSSADNNTGGFESSGIALIMRQTPTVRGLNPVVSNCTANSNGNFGLLIGYFEDLNRTMADITIIDSIFDRNGSAVGPAAGINIEPVVGGTRNLLIKGCQINDTGSAASTLAAGINAANGTNVVIEDSNIFNTTAAGAGHGILFNNMTDSKIIRTQVHGNKNSGVELVGTNTDVAIIESIAMHNDIGFDFAAGSTASCCLVQDSRALSNTSFGFVHAPAPLTTVFIGNEAQCNGTPTTTLTNYAINGGTISLQEMAIGTGVLTQVGPTNAALGAHFTNLSVVP